MPVFLRDTYTSERLSGLHANDSMPPNGFIGDSYGSPSMMSTTFFDAVAGEIGDEGVGNFGDPFIPMFVHEVVDDAGIGLGEVGIYILSGAAIFYGGDKEHFGAVGRHGEACHTVFHACDHMAVGSVGIHHPHLRLAVLGCNEGYAASAVNPYGLVFRVGRAGEPLHVGAVGVHYKELVVALVLLNALIADAIKNFSAVGRYLRVRHTAEGLESLDGEFAVGGLEVGLVDQAAVAAAASAQT